MHVRSSPPNMSASVQSFPFQCGAQLPVSSLDEAPTSTFVVPVSRGLCLIPQIGGNSSSPTARHIPFCLTAAVCKLKKPPVSDRRSSGHIPRYCCQVAGVNRRQWARLQPISPVNSPDAQNPAAISPTWLDFDNWRPYNSGCVRRALNKTSCWVAISITHFTSHGFQAQEIWATPSTFPR
ncbi:hypothetical protein M011DRAFT_87918 [Sporormia fimetaria CBS 119925]|uniref:Uncharacterized protein n=1 Tax=Sporormia fimetaria CBS 119925 TaxID=1340428 RepID=A0A6A6VBA4_9PLEO|nr:hypothetical protein M011DRAFT_87918 [Sporormia fimetaria CBS 119925]